MLILFFILTCVAPLLGSASSAAMYASPRIILGSVSDNFNVSFYCTLFVDFPSDAGTSLCGCAIYSPGLAVSAAHCFKREDENFSNVRLRLYGKFHKSQMLLTVKPERVFVHPDHSFVSLQNDIAVFRVPETVDSAPLLQVNELEETWEALSAQDELIVVGVGLMRSAKLALQYHTSSLSLGIPRETSLSRRDCDAPRGFGNLRPWAQSAHQGDLCAGPFAACEAGVCADSCQGDSGGPLFSRSTSPEILFGVVSRGAECGLFGGLPGIYTPLHKHTHFLQYVTKKDATAAVSGAAMKPRFFVFIISIFFCILR